MRKIIKVSVLFLFVFAVYFLTVKYFRIKSIVCQSQFSKCSGELQSKLDAVDKKGVAETKKVLIGLLESEALVKRYNLQLDLHGKYTVKVQEREVKHCINYNGENYYSDKEGFVFRKGSAGNYTCVSTDRFEGNIGSSLSGNEINAMKLVHFLRNVSDLSSYKLIDGYLTVVYKGNIKLIFPIENINSELVAGKVYYIVSQFDIIKEYIIKNGYNGVSELDFRFKDPVVRLI